MTAKRRPASEVARFRGKNDVWIEHAVLDESHVAQFRGVERMTLWNVRFPDDIWLQLPGLKWLDLRGGTRDSLLHLRRLKALEYLQLNQVRGLATLDELSRLSSLKFLSIYGLSRVTAVPSLRSLSNLRRLEIGQMKRLKSLKPMLEAPNLRELLLIEEVPFARPEVELVNSHPSLAFFDWFATRVPKRRTDPVLAAGIGLKKTRAIHPDAWFTANA